MQQYANANTQLRGKVEGLLLRLWRGLTGWRDADARAFAGQAVPIVRGGQQAVGRLTDAYLAKLLGDVLETTVRPVGIDPERVSDLRGVDPIEVYQRPFESIWTGLHDGVPLDDAIERGRERLIVTGLTDLELAKTHASHDVLAEFDEVVGYRRVLVGEENCGLCIIASTQRYHREELLPIHPGCDCGIAPIVGEFDPGQIISVSSAGPDATEAKVTRSGVKVFNVADLRDEGELLEAAHTAINERFGFHDRGGRDLDYRKILLVKEHGELGPLLTVASHRFTSEDDL